MMKAKKKVAKKPSLAERVKALREECDAELDRLAEELRPKNERGAIPAVSLRAMWVARGRNAFDSYLIAVGQL